MAKPYGHDTRVFYIDPDGEKIDLGLYDGVESFTTYPTDRFATFGGEWEEVVDRTNQTTEITFLVRGDWRVNREMRETFGLGTPPIQKTVPTADRFEAVVLLTTAMALLAMWLLLVGA